MDELNHFCGLELGDRVWYTLSGDDGYIIRFGEPDTERNVLVSFDNGTHGWVNDYDLYYLSEG